LVTKTRLLAHELLMAVEISGTYPNIALPKMLKNSELDKKDRGFLQELAYGTLRMQIQYDAVIGQMATLADLDRDVLIVLRLATHEYLNMRTSDHAVVDQYVELSKRVRPRASGLVNAVLRRLTREKKALLDSATGSGSNLETSYSHPRWIINALATSRELDNAGPVVDLLEVNNQSPTPQMVALPPADVPEQAMKLEHSSFGFESDEELDLKNYRFQDQGSQLVTEMAAKAARDGNWLDMCAGPGGKASLLAALAKQRGSTLTASELYPHRAKLVEKALQQFPNTTVVAADATKYEYPSKYDLVLIDAPCTGLGALRRKPESRHNKKPSQIRELNTLQHELLRKAATVVSDGGIIAYVTCSPVIEETTAVARWFLSTHPEFELLPWYEFSDIDANRERKTLQLWSDKHNSDCMFLALFQRQ
jgi:16S rRNA (cytosine967-C5)-methyltransferase